MRVMARTQRPARSAIETDVAEITARILLETEAVLFRPDDPFTFTSGRLSPVYVDCRKLISFPRARRITLLSLATWWDVAEMAEKLGRFEPGQYEKVQRFLKDPESWPAARAAARR